MSNWINVGARYGSDGTDIPTKSALKRALADNPTDVILYETTMGRTDIEYVGTQIGHIGAPGDKYTVTGPNPYTSRKWYATVERNQKGNIVVK